MRVHAAVSNFGLHFTSDQLSRKGIERSNKQKRGQIQSSTIDAEENKSTKSRKHAYGFESSIRSPLRNGRSSAVCASNEKSARRKTACGRGVAGGCGGGDETAGPELPAPAGGGTTCWAMNLPSAVASTCSWIDCPSGPGTNRT